MQLILIFRTQMVFEKSKLIPNPAIRNRAPLATSRRYFLQVGVPWEPAQRSGLATQAKPTFPCGTLRERGFENLDFWLVRLRGLCLCSSELYSPKTFKTSSQEPTKNSL
jgi:hypothetical protein